MILVLQNIYAVLPFMYARIFRYAVELETRTRMSYKIWTSLALLLVAITLSFVVVQYEHFLGSPDSARCGVDQPPCPFGTYCANGYCIGTTPPSLPRDTGLPVFP